LKGSLSVYLFTSFIGDLIVPVYSLFIPLLAADSGASPAEVGIVGGASYVAYSFMPFIIGRYSDRMKVRQGFVLGALAVLATVSLIYVYVASPVQLIATRVVEGVGWSMLWPTVQAAIAEDTQREASKSLSIYNTVWSAAAAIGPVVGATLFFFSSIRTIFMVSVALLLFAVVINLAPTKRRRKREDGPPEGAEILRSDPRVHVSEGSIASYRTWFYMTALAFVMAVRGVLFTFALPYAKASGGPVVLVAYVALFFGASRFVTYLFTLRDEIRGWLLAPGRIRRNIVVGLVFASLGGALPVVPDKTGATFLVSFIIVGVAASLVTAIAQTEMMRLDPARRGENAGLQESSIGVGVGLGPIAAGLASGGSLVVPFFFPLTGILVVIPVMVIGTRRHVERPVLGQESA
jgi:MFS family permease